MISRNIRYGVFILIALAFIMLVPEILRSGGAKRAEILSSELQQEVVTVFDTVFAQYQEPTRTMARDYSIWDEMVDLAEGRKGLDWAHNNIDVSLDTYSTTGTWVFSATGELRYGVLRRSDGTSVEMEPFFLPASSVLEIGTSKEQENFYIKGPDGMYFISIGGIVPVTDPERLGEVRGYLVVATLLSSDALSAIGETTATTISEEPASDSTPANTIDTSSGLFVFWKNLTDYSGKSVATLRIQRTISSIALYSQILVRERTYAYIGVLCVMLAVGASLYLLDRSRERAQQLADSMTVKIREDNTLLEQRVAERTAELKIGIAQREAAEATLLKRTAELERMNKVMMDREMRILELKKGLDDAQGGEQKS